MPGPSITFPMQLDQTTRKELEALLAQLNEGFLYVEHNEDGTHGDITANSITLNQVTTTDPQIILYDEQGRPVTLDATDREGLSGGESVLRIAVDGLDASVDGEPAIVDIGYLSPHTGGFSDGPGIFLREWVNSPLTLRQGWAITASPFDLLLTGRTMLAITDTREDKIVYAIRPVGAPGAVTEYVVGPISAAALGTPVNLGRFVNGERWNEIHGVTHYALTAYILGSATTSGVRLDIDSGALEIREGDDSDYKAFRAKAATIVDSVQVSSTSGNYLLGPATTSGVLLRLSGGGALEVRVGDDSGYQHLVALSLFANGVVNTSDGTASMPAYGYNSDPATGRFLVAAGNEGVSLSGALAVVFTNKTTAQGYGTSVVSGAFGTGNVAGSFLSAGRNTSGLGAAATLRLERMSGGYYYIWPDDTGLARISNAPPQESGAPADTSGTVIGDQFSQRSEKHILSEHIDHDLCLETILSTPVFDFTYKDGRYHGQRFTGITTDDSPVFGKDHGKALNEITLFGYLINAMKAQQQQIEDLRSEVARLRVE